MISWAWGRRCMGNTRANRSGSSTQPPAIWGVSEEVAQVSNTSGSAGEPARPAPVGGHVAVGHVGRGVDRQPGLGGDDRVVVVDLAGGGQRVPERDGHAEEPLAADQPVAVQAGHPVLVAGAHERRLPLQLPAPLQQPLAVGQQADEPLAAGHDLQRPVAVLVELHRVGDRPGLAGQVAGGPQQLHHPAPGLGGGLAGQLGPGRAGGHAVGRVGLEAAVAGHDRAHRQPQLPPPEHVGEVAEGADHGQPGPLAGVGQPVGDHRDRHPEQRRGRGRADQVAVAVVVGVGDQGHAGGQQLRPGRLHHQVPRPPGAPAAGPGPEPHPHGQAGDLAVLDLGLGDGGPVGHVPQGRGLGLVGLARGQLAQEPALGGPPGPLADGGVGQRPVDRQAELAPERLEHLLVGVGQAPAQLDEVGPRDGQLGAWAGWPAARSPGRRAARGRSGPRSSSRPGARSAGRCRPSRPGRTPPGRACAGTGPGSRCGSRRRRGRRAGTR